MWELAVAGAAKKVCVSVCFVYMVRNKEKICNEKKSFCERLILCKMFFERINVGIQKSK